MTRWEAPPELLHSSPRPVRLTGAGKAVAGLALALVGGALFGGMWLYDAAMRDQVQFQSREKERVSTEAEVVDLRSSRGKNARYLVIYQYRAGGQVYRKQVAVRRTEWQKLQAGSRLEVRYVPSNPELSWIPGHEPRGIPVWLVPLMSGGLALASWAIAQGIRKQRRLLSEGRPAQAQVMRSERFHRSHSHGNRVHYQFEALSGATCQGQYETAKAPPEPGTEITIIYDPDNLKDQARYPLSLVRAE